MLEYIEAGFHVLVLAGTGGFADLLSEACKIFKEKNHKPEKEKVKDKDRFATYKCIYLHISVSPGVCHRVDFRCKSLIYVHRYRFIII